MLEYSVEFGVPVKTIPLKVLGFFSLFCCRYAYHSYGPVINGFVGLLFHVFYSYSGNVTAILNLIT